MLYLTMHNISLAFNNLQICLQKTNYCKWSLHDFHVEGPYLMLMRCNLSDISCQHWPLNRYNSELITQK